MNINFKEHYLDELDKRLQERAEQRSISQKVEDDKLWNIKYTVGLEIARESYLLHSDRLKQTDEKINKYLVFLSIIMAGFISIIASSNVDSLKIDFDSSKLLSGMSLVTIFLLLFGFFYLLYVILKFLRCLKFVESVKIGTVNAILDDTVNDSEILFKEHLIQKYDFSINSIHAAIETKNDNILIASKHLGWCVFCIMISVILLFSIKIVGINMGTNDNKPDRPRATSYKPSNNSTDKSRVEIPNKNGTFLCRENFTPIGEVILGRDEMPSEFTGENSK